MGCARRAAAKAVRSYLWVVSVWVAAVAQSLRAVLPELLI
jgi:hypothetical protein